MNCPVCGKSLASTSYEGVVIDTCESCGGQWLDSGELGHILRARENRFGKTSPQVLKEHRAPRAVNVNEHGRVLKCPKCGGQTESMNYAGDTGIVLDKCAGCGGIWFDAKELESVQRIYENQAVDYPGGVSECSHRLRGISVGADQETAVKVSRFNLVNALIDRIVDLI